MNSTCCRRAPDCEPSLCRCTCPRCNRTKTPNMLKAAATAAIAINFMGKPSKKRKFNGGHSYKWPGSPDDSGFGSLSSSSSESSFGRRSSTSSSSSSSYSFGAPQTPSDSSVFGFPEEPQSPFSPQFGKASPFS